MFQVMLLKLGFELKNKVLLLFLTKKKTLFVKQIYLNVLNSE